MRHGQRFGLGEVGDSERDLEDAMVGAGRKAQTGDRLVEQFGGGLIQAAVFFNIPGTHLGIAIDLARSRKPLPLPHPRPINPGTDGSRRLAGRLAHQFLDLNRRHLDMHVDPVQQRPGQPAAVALHLKRTAGARADPITQKPAGTLVRYLLQKNSGI